MQQDKKFSTTRLLTKEKPEIISSNEDKFETVLLLPEGENRIGEGGLRTHGDFKKSYSDKPLVSIVTVVYNGYKYLEETILSVINQTYDNVEYVIIDGGSSDRTVDIIKKYEDRIDYWMSEKDNGIYDAMNKGISLCQGELIGIINADDWYELNALELISNVYIKNNGTILYASMNVIGDNDKIIFTKKVTKELSLLCKGMIFNHPSVFVPTSLYKKYGNFSLSYKVAADWNLMLMFYLNKENFVNIDKILSNFRLGGLSYTNDMYAIKEKHLIRKHNCIYDLIDWYYLYDIIKYFIFRKYLTKISIIKQKLFSKVI